jgi:beta-glucanase (GH16 family)
MEKRKGVIWMIVASMIFSGVQMMAGPPDSINWELKWSEEFDGEVLDPTWWTIGQEWTQNDCNYPSAYSINGKPLVEVSGGTLKLRGWDEPSGGKSYTGALVKTRQSGTNPALFTFHYGYLEVRVKRTAIGEGFHINCYTYAYNENALSSSSLGGHTWPSEIDFAETLSRDYYRDKILNALHIDKGTGHISHEQWNDGIDWSHWHTYGFHWKESGYVDFYIDGELTFSTTERLLPDLPHYLVLRMGIGGWIGAPDENTQFPGIQEVDWVRYYQPVVTQEIDLNSPVSGDIYPIDTPIDLEVDVTTYSDTAKYVVYYLDDIAIDTVYTPPFGTTVQPKREGRYTLTAAVFDGNGRKYLSDEVYITAGDISTNLIFNGGFEQGLSPWELSTASGAVADVEISNQDPLSGTNSARIDITTPTTGLSNIILRQKMYLEKDQTYRFSILARADSPRKLAVNIRQLSPLRTYLFEVIDLNIDKTVHSYTFKPFSGTFNGLVEFFAGGNSSSIWVDSVRLNTTFPVGVGQEGLQQGSLIIYPNPSTGSVEIALPGGQNPAYDLVLVDLAGRVIMHISQHLFNEGYLRLDLNYLTPGVYLVTSDKPEGFTPERLILF